MGRTLVDVSVFWRTWTTFSCEATSSIVFGRLIETQGM